MKRKITKILKVLLIIILLFGLMFNTKVSFATEETANTEVNVVDIISGLLDGVLGIFLNIFNILPVTIGGVIQMIAASVANIGGYKFTFLQLDDILFNEVPILSVNFFATIDNSVVANIRTNIAIWYYALRNIAIVISLVVLIYIGIRMAISTIAEDKAKYKKMLIDWVVGFITIFLIHYIIVITVNVNDLLINMFSNYTKDNLDGGFAGSLALNAVNLLDGFVKGFTSSILYLFLTVMIMMFLISYVKRMLTVAFLIIIAPIITVTYSIDKIGDGKSQALNTWLKEFVYNVLIQPFHCIIYLAFMTIVIGLVGTPNDQWFEGAGLGASVFAIFTMIFIKQAEPIVRKIFGFDNASSLGSALASGALLMSSMKTASNAIGGAKEKKESEGKGPSGAKNTNSSRPKTSNNAARNVNNINNSQSSSESNNSQTSSRNNANQTSQGNNANQTSQQSGTSQENNANQASQQSGTSQGNDANQTSQQNSNDELNINKSQTNKEKLKNMAKKLPTAYVNAGFRVAGTAIGAFASDDFVTGGMTGYNYGKALGIGTVDKGRKIVNTATRKTHFKKQTGELVDAYKKLQTDMGWSDELMYNQSDRLLQLSSDTLNKVSNPKVREYGEKLHKYREQFEGRYQEPSDMVLHTIKQVQNGSLTNDKDSIKRYTRKK